jgi:hypothetical protein
VGVDFYGGPAIDPTKNVMDLFDAGSKRQDDLREITNRLYDDAMRHLHEVTDLRAYNTEFIANLRAVHQTELRMAEASRLDSIRAVDREEVTKAAAAASQAIATLAQQTTSLAVTLRSQVDTVATAVENRQIAFSEGVNKRLSALELGFSEGKGKQTVTDPQIEKLAEAVGALVRMQAEEKGKATVSDPALIRLTEAVGVLIKTQENTTGRGQGINSLWIFIIGGAGLFLTVLTIGGFLIVRPAASPVYMQAPAQVQPR